MRLFTPQPAQKIYAFDRGWRVLRRMSIAFFEQARQTDKQLNDKTDDWKHERGDKDWFTSSRAYALTIGCQIAAKVQYITTALVALLFIVIWSIAMLLWMGGSLISIGVLTIYTALFLLYFGIFTRCQLCQKSMTLPEFRCNKCTTKHTRLVPSIYGILFHRCTGGATTGAATCNEKLATLDGRGREKLTKYCIHCHVPLNPSIGLGTNVHIALVGGPSSGKSNYIVQSTKVFKEEFERSSDYQIKFADDKDRKGFEENVRRLSKGIVLLKTPDIRLPAYNLEIKRPRSVPKLAYIYDVAGETFHTDDKIREQDFYSYNQGIIFIIDPCTIPEYRHKHEKEIARLNNSLRPSSLDVTEVYERMVARQEDATRKRVHPIPIAIVINKVDALGLENEIGEGAIAPLLSKGVSKGDAIHLRTREFLLKYGLRNLVHDIETHFPCHRYFSCSSLGRMPDPKDTRSFTPIRVLEPLEWLLVCVKAVKSKQKYLPTKELLQINKAP